VHSICRQHGDLMFRLACGRLEPGHESEARVVRASCSSCSTWWREEITARTADLDSAVAGAFAAFSAPTRSTRSRWLPLAAAAVLALAVGLFLRPVSPPADLSQSVEQSSTLSEESFEIDTLDLLDLSDFTLTLVEGEGQSRQLFDGSLESGDLSTWSSHS